MIPFAEKIYYPYEMSLFNLGRLFGFDLDTWNVPREVLLRKARELEEQGLVTWVVLESYSHPVPRLVSTGEYVFS